MKSQAAVAFVLGGLLMAALAAAQNQPSNPKPGLEKREPLFFVKIAADVAGNVQHSSLNGFVGLYVSSENWGSGLKDADLAPFLKVKEPKANRSAACLFSGDKDVAICVYFDGETPFGVTAVKAGASGKIEASDVSAAYKDISKEMLKKSERELHFEPSDISTDDGQQLPAFAVSTGAKFPTT